MSLKNFYFVLVRPQMGENIGATARALKNFNLTNLRIVNPRCAWPNKKAIATSVGAKDILNSTKIFKSVEKSVGDLNLVFATTARMRKDNKKMISMLDFYKEIRNKKKIGLIFGPESSGLSNNEINVADYLVKIPTNKNFSSLNLSHSVILFCFYIFQKVYKKQKIKVLNSLNKSAKKSDVNIFLNFLIKNLDKKGFLQPNHKRHSMIRNIKNIFYRSNLSIKEIRILLGVFAVLNRFNEKT